MTGEHNIAQAVAQLTHFGVPKFDSLGWARDEITDALVSARAALARVTPDIEEAAQHIQQASRALEVIGLDAESHVLAAATALANSMASGDGEASEYTLALIKEAIDSIDAALEARAAGKPILALQWLPLYRQLRQSCGEAVRASDLFYPDLNRRPVRPEARSVTLPEHLLNQQARFEHRRFERGLRTWLREPAASTGVAEMRRAALAIERGQRLPAARAFWWAVTALFDALHDGGLEITPELNQLIQGIERQIRHLLVGAVRVPDALMREVLYHLAIATSDAPLVGAVRDAYQLSALLPAGVPTVVPGAPVPAPGQARLEEIAAALSHARSGETAAYDTMRQALAALSDAASGHASPPLGRLLQVCREATDWLIEIAGNDLVSGELLALELCNSLPVLSRALASPGQHDAEVERQADLLGARLAEQQFSQVREVAPALARMPAPAAHPNTTDEPSRQVLLRTVADCFEQIETGLQATLQKPVQPPAENTAPTLEALAQPLQAMDAALVRLGAQHERSLLDACAQGVRTLTEMGTEAEEAIYPELVRDIETLGEALARLGAEKSEPTAVSMLLAGGVSAPDDELIDSLRQVGDTSSLAEMAERIAAARAAEHPVVEMERAAPIHKAADSDQPVAEPTPDELSRDEFMQRAGGLVAQIGSQLGVWQAAPRETGYALPIVHLVRPVKRGAEKIGAREVAERAQGALVMLEANPPSLAASERAIVDLIAALDALTNQPDSRAAPPEALEVQQAEPPAEISLAPSLALPVATPITPMSVTTPDIDRLSRSINDSTEISLTAGQMADEIERMREGMQELQQRAAAIAVQVRSVVRAAPKHASVQLQQSLASLGESAKDLSELQAALTRRVGRAETLLENQVRMQRELHRSLLDMHNLPVDRLRERLSAVLLQMAEAEGVPAHLSLTGDPLSLPPALLQALGDLLEDLVRQIAAPDHTRAALDIDLDITARGHELAIALGPVASHTALDLEGIRQRLSTLPVPPGCEVERVPRSGAGDTLRFSLVQPAAAVSALLVSAGRTRVALPAHLVLHRQLLEGVALTQAREAGHFSLEGESYPLRELAELLGVPGSPERRAQLLLMRSGKWRLALVCESRLIERELVLKKTTSVLSRVPGVIGASVLGDNEVVLLVNPLLLAACKPRDSAGTEPPALQPPLRVLLVDDSATAREHARAALEEAGYEVVAVRSGGQALDYLTDVNFSAMVVDSDMPGMDGLELVRRLMMDPALKVPPIIMTGSRLNPEHREAARRFGVSHYLPKPCAPKQLVAMVQSGVSGRGVEPMMEDAVRA